MVNLCSLLLLPSLQETQRRVVRVRRQVLSDLNRTPPLRLPQPSGGRDGPRRTREGVKLRELPRSRKEEQRRVCIPGS